MLQNILGYLDEERERERERERETERETERERERRVGYQRMLAATNVRYLCGSVVHGVQTHRYFGHMTCKSSRLEMWPMNEQTSTRVWIRNDEHAKAEPKIFLFPVTKVEEDRVSRSVQVFFFWTLTFLAMAKYSVPTRRWTTVLHTHFRLYFYCV